VEEKRDIENWYYISTSSSKNAKHKNGKSIELQAICYENEKRCIMHT
jgi:hypothetical protein